MTEAEKIARLQGSLLVRIKSRKYECFIEDHDSKPWTPGQCAGYAGRGSLATHLFRCKRKDGHGLGNLFCAQHARTTEH